MSISGNTTHNDIIGNDSGSRTDEESLLTSDDDDDDDDERREERTTDDDLLRTTDDDDAGGIAQARNLFSLSPMKRKVKLRDDYLFLKNLLRF
jgi:hypothetical protein